MLIERNLNNKISQNKEENKNTVNSNQGIIKSNRKFNKSNYESLTYKENKKHPSINIRENIKNLKCNPNNRSNSNKLNKSLNSK